MGPSTVMGGTGPLRRAQRPPGSAPPLLRSAIGRRVLTQAVKRSAVDLRPVLGIDPQRSSAALAHVASAYALGAAFLDDQDGEKLAATVELLEAERCSGFDELCFGYHFDVQTRVFFYPRGAPNTIATAFAGRAYLDAYDETRDRQYLQRAESTAEFFLRHVPQTPDGEGAYFGYLVGDRTPIHNASMLVAAVLARVAAATGRHDLHVAAAEAVKYTASRQRADGSWPYGERRDLDWIDGFHTGYVLESLMACASAGVAVDSDVVTRGLAYYRQHLFGPDGTPRYDIKSTYPLDSQALAQGIETFALAGSEDAGARAFARMVFEFGQRAMRSRDGLYLFQRRPHWKNPTPHVRWTIAPMLLALVHLARVEATAR